MKIFYIITLLELLSFPALSGINLDQTSSLEEIDPDSLIVDALLPQHSSTLFISKHGKNPEALTYQLDWFEYVCTLQNRQKFSGFAPLFLENRDGIFAFKYLAPHTQEKAQLYAWEQDKSFRLFHTFENDSKNIATTLASNFIATIDYPPTDPVKVPLSLARLKLWNTMLTPDGFGLQEKANVKITNQKQIVKEQQPSQNSLDFTNIFGRVTALAMSPLGRIKNPGQPDIAANRMIAVAHSLGTINRLHVWYFPDLTNDFTKSQGHFPMTWEYPIDTIVFSPNTFGLMLLTNKQEGKIWVLKVEYPKKSSVLYELMLEKALLPNATHIQAVFGPHDEILAGINQSLYLFKKNEDGSYHQADVQPVKDFAINEPFSKILNSGPSFLAIGIKGHVQFGRID